MTVVLLLCRMMKAVEVIMKTIQSTEGTNKDVEWYRERYFQIAADNSQPISPASTLETTLTLSECEARLLNLSVPAALRQFMLYL